MANFYLERFGYPHKFINSPHSENLKIAVVIPSFNEPDLITTLDSLNDCSLPPVDCEIIVVINEPENCTREISKINSKTYQEVRDFSESANTNRLMFIPIYAQALPKDKAGVGLARKIGMDEAIRRINGSSDNILVSLDADCVVDKNYLTAIYNHFELNKDLTGCSIYFEHLLPEDPGIRELIIAYELHLRYYVNALRWSKYPLAFQTVGSCFAVRAYIYEKQGGMNTRQAGEDFYFLQKIIQLGGFSDLTSTTVYPSSRISNRTPFGTGKSLEKLKNEKQILFYSPKMFIDLKNFFDISNSFYDLEMNEINVKCSYISNNLKNHLDQIDFSKNLMDFKVKHRSKVTFRKAFFRWFNALKVLQFVRSEKNGLQSDTECLEWLNNEIQFSHSFSDDLEALLIDFRRFDKNSRLTEINP